MVAATFLINTALSLFLLSLTFLAFFFFLREASDHLWNQSHPSLSQKLMEPKPHTNRHQPITDTAEAKKKTGGAVQFFRVALFMLRRRSNKSKAPVDMGSDKGMWRRLLGSMRPLHIQGNESTHAAPLAAVPKGKEEFDESPSPLPSPSPSFSPASRSSSFSTSMYASACNLQELDEGSSDEGEQAMKDDSGGDEMIDAKAEEFIAQFYEQMRRQRYDAY